MSSREILKYSAPFIEMGTAWVAKRAFKTGYERLYGEPVPSVDDLTAPLGKVLAFSIGTAVVSTTVLVLVNRSLARATEPELDFEQMA